MWNFIPDEEKNDEFKVPYFEDARSDYAPYYSTDKTESRARSEVIAELKKLGAYDVVIQSGHFEIHGQKRFGFAIHFRRDGVPGLLRVAGLPMRSTTPVKKSKVLTQALLNVRDWLKTAVTNRTFSPGNDVLTPLMLVDANRGITIGDLMTNYLETGRLPQLGAGDETVEVVEGDFTEG